MSLSKSKCWYSNICLHFYKRAVPFTEFMAVKAFKCVAIKANIVWLFMAVKIFKKFVFGSIFG